MNCEYPVFLSFKKNKRENEVYKSVMLEGWKGVVGFICDYAKFVSNSISIVLFSNNSILLDSHRKTGVGVTSKSPSMYGYQNMIL